MNKTTKNELVTVNNAIATTNKKVVANNEKVNDILSIDNLYNFFTNNGILPKFTDNVNYVGCGTRSNTFSVNVKKSQYNIYCNDERFDIVSKLKLTKTDFVKNGNAIDKTRNNKIVCKSTDELQKMLVAILKVDNKIATVKSN